MGLSFSSMHTAQPLAKVVLVPPMFERDLKHRDRFVESPYAYLCGEKRDLHHLCNDFLAPPPSCKVLFSPPADPRLTVAALVGLQRSQMVLRYQPLGVHNTHTFVDWQGDSRRPGDAALRASIFDPDTGMGMFCSLPCAKRISGTLAQVGVRYSSPSFTTGVIVQPRSGDLSAVWMAGRYADLLGAVEWEPKATLADLSNTFQRWKTANAGEPLIGSMLRQQSKVALMYEPTFNSPAGQGRFSACIELRNGLSLAVSFFQHMAVSRRVFNPTEAKGVVGITNYIDLGMEIVIPTSTSHSPTTSKPSETSVSNKPRRNVRSKQSDAQQGQQQPQQARDASSAQGELKQGQTEGVQGSVEAGSVNLAAAWQINKNWLLKGRLGSESIALAVAARNWHSVGVIGAVNASWKYGDWKGPKLGAHIQLENFGALRYERGVSEASGRAVLQRHEAEEQDIANMGGQGRQVLKGVPRAEYDSPPPDVTRDFL